MVNPTDEDTKHIKDQNTGTKGYLEYTKTERKRQGKPTRCGEQKRPTQTVG